MSRKIGCPVGSCQPGAPEEAAGTPVDKEKHKNCAIKILSIKEKDNEVGPEFAGGRSEISVKHLNDDLIIKYEVKVCTMSVTLWIEFDPGNKVHADFYKTYEGNGVTSPRLVVILSGESKAPGVHEALWDGRDRTPDHRILLEGTYKARIQGLHDAIPEDQTTIRFARPLSANFGIDYPNNTTKDEIDKVRIAQTRLSDGTAFEADSSCATTAQIAWGQFGACAVGSVSGHSSPTALAFYPEESAPGRPAAFRRNKQSAILTRNRQSVASSKRKPDIDSSVFLPEEPSAALRDVFLLVLAGCRAGNELLLVQTRLEELSKAFNPGKIDGKHGNKTAAALRAWQVCERIEPADGTTNATTLQRLGIDASLDEVTRTLAVQRKLAQLSKSYHPGHVDGEWSDATFAALSVYQGDHSPPLEWTGLPDEATVRHLQPAGSMAGESRNIAEAFVDMGCNIAIAFNKKVSFTGSRKWHIHFWELAARGVGIDDAASQAHAMCGAKYRNELKYSVFARHGVDKGARLLPARHGRDL